MTIFIKAVPGKLHSVIYTNIDGRHFRFSGGTWAWRNHNPGNLRPKNKGRFKYQIGVVNRLVSFPTDQLGHEAFVRDLKENYMDDSIDRMILHFAPPNENDTKKYAKFLHEKTGVYDDRPLKDFTQTQFKKLWMAIQQMEGYKVGKITEVFRVEKVEIIQKDLYKFYLENNKPISEKKCIEMAKSNKLELEVCTSDLGNVFLRTPPKSAFQKPLHTLKKKRK